MQITINLGMAVIKRMINGWVCGIQATACLGDVGALRHRLRIAFHPIKLPRIATVANSTPVPT